MRERKSISDSHDKLSKAVISGIKLRLDELVEEEVKKATESINSRLLAEFSGVSLEIMSELQVQFGRDNITITLKRSQ